MASLARLIAGGAGLGHAPRAPGTVASAVATGLGAVLLAWTPIALPLAALAVTLGGVWAIRRSDVGAEDPAWVVIDEVAGQLVAMLPLAGGSWPRWPALLVVFILFRLFDIVKPEPVGWIDRRTGPLAVMGDDLAAGALAAAVLWAGTHLLG